MDLMQDLGKVVAVVALGGALFLGGIYVGARAPRPQPAPKPAPHVILDDPYLRAEITFTPQALAAYDEQRLRDSATFHLYNMVGNMADPALFDAYDNLDLECLVRKQGIDPNLLLQEWNESRQETDPDEPYDYLPGPPYSAPGGERDHVPPEPK